MASLLPQEGQRYISGEGKWIGYAYVSNRVIYRSTKHYLNCTHFWKKIPDNSVIITDLPIIPKKKKLVIRKPQGWFDQQLIKHCQLLAGN